LFRWFVGLNMDESVWVPTVYSKNRDRLLAGDVAEKFFAEVLGQARAADLLSDERFRVLLRSLTAMRGRVYEWTDVESRVMQRCRIARQ
jgi:transposase